MDSTKRKKARPTAATVERAMRESNLDIGDSRVKDNTRNSGNQASIASLLMVGNNNGLHLRELVQITGKDERQIRREIQSERKAGRLILSDCEHGYFLPSSAEDVRKFIRSMSRRSREISAISRAAEDALAGLTGQQFVRGW